MPRRRRRKYANVIRARAYRLGAKNQTDRGEKGKFNSVLATYNKASSVVLMPQGFPDSAVTKLRWSGSKNIPVNNGDDPAFIYIRGNGPYDPDVASGGYYPYYYDNYAALYDNYVCYASKIKVTFLGPVANADGQKVVFGVVPFVVPATLPTTLRVNEVPYASHKYAQLNISSITPSIKKYMTTQKIFGVSKTKVRDDDKFSALTNSNVPASEWRWAIYASRLAADPNLGAIANVAIDIQVTYYVKFFGRAELAPRVSVPMDPPEP